MSRRRKAGPLVLLLACLGTAWVLDAARAVGSGPTERPISANAYSVRLDRAASLAREGVTSPSRTLMARLQATVGLPLVVAFGGERVSVPDDRYLDGLGGDGPADFRAALRRLEALAAAARAAARTPVLDRDRVAGATDRALQGLSTSESVLARIRTAIGRALRSVHDVLFRYRGVGTLVGWALVLAVGVALVLLLRRFGIGWVPASEVDAEPPSTSLGPKDWRQEAERALARGDGAAAVRALYAAIVASLRARGIVPDRPSLTSGECRAAVAAAAPNIYPAVADASWLFERVTYGLEPADDQHVARLREVERSVAAA